MFRETALTRDQARRIARAIDLARRRAMMRGEIIDSDEAIRRISQAYIADHGG